ncbi:MAG TPA: DJ-1/PfpI family protein [Pyrinomonadaceae bacterium]|nr:DJ-1/PfpI family protein [Pyrinomonadaceae bacterium]
MHKETPGFNIAIPIYEGVDLMDVAAPCEMFNWMGVYWKERAVTVELVEAEGRVVKTRDGAKLTPDKSFSDYQKHHLQAQLLWVPGGDPTHLQKTMRNSRYLNFLRKQSTAAVYVTSVCEGALLLASAGLLDGYSATTHWAFIPCLKSFPKIKVAAGYPRYVVDRNRVTGGGISSGLDEALELIALVSSYEIATQVQLVTQYFPRPPFNGTITGAEDCPIKIKKAK